MKSIAGLSVLLVALAPLGCNRGPQLGQVRGTVTWEGKPLVKATVTFTPDDGQSAFARTAEDGSYVLKFSDGRDGAVVGENTVTIETFRIDLDAEGNPIEHREILPPQFHLDSEIVKTVDPGKQIIDFDLQQDE